MAEGGGKAASGEARLGTFTVVSCVRRDERFGGEHYRSSNIGNWD